MSVAASVEGPTLAVTIDEYQTMTSVGILSILVVVIAFRIMRLFQAPQSTHDAGRERTPTATIQLWTLVSLLGWVASAVVAYVASYLLDRDINGRQLVYNVSTALLSATKNNTLILLSSTFASISYPLIDKLQWERMKRLIVVIYVGFAVLNIAAIVAVVIMVSVYKMLSIPSSVAVVQGSSLFLLVGLFVSVANMSRVSKSHFSLPLRLRHLSKRLYPLSLATTIASILLHVVSFVLNVLAASRRLDVTTVGDSFTIVGDFLLIFFALVLSWKTPADAERDLTEASSLLVQSR